MGYAPNLVSFMTPGAQPDDGAAQLQRQLMLANALQQQSQDEVQRRGQGFMPSTQQAGGMGMLSGMMPMMMRGMGAGERNPVNNTTLGMMGSGLMGMY